MSFFTSNAQFSYRAYCHYYNNDRCLPAQQPSSATYQGYKEGSFFFLERNPQPNNPNAKMSYGWKIHISIDDSDKGKHNLSRAWDIIKDIIIKHDIQKAKVVTPDGNFAYNQNLAQFGKQGTLACLSDFRVTQHSFWQEILQEIEEAFIKHRIAPDPTPTAHHEQRITGSHYCTYRNDAKFRPSHEKYAHILSYLKQIPIQDRSNYSIFTRLSIDNIPSCGLPIPLSAEAVAANLGLMHCASTDAHGLATEISKLEVGHVHAVELCKMCDVFSDEYVQEQFCEYRG